MSSITRVPITDVLGSSAPPVEESWSKDVPQEVGANAQPVVEFDRDKAVIASVGKSGNKRMSALAADARASLAMGAKFFNGNSVSVSSVSSQHHFFVFKGKKLEYIGSSEVDTSKFDRDISGRFFREWLKKNFPDRKDYDEIVTFSDSMTMKQFVELLNI